MMVKFCLKVLGSSFETCQKKENNKKIKNFEKNLTGFELVSKKLRSKIVG
jgi:phage regulator Rha-like protein